MSIAVTDDHRALAETAADFLRKADARGAARALLEADTEPRPAFWGELANLGWLGLHLPESVGGAGYTLEELVVVVEELGAAVAPGPFVPTVVASALIAAAADEATKESLLPGLADGTKTAAIALQSSVTVSGGLATGTAEAVLAGGTPDLLVIAAGEDVLVIDAADASVSLAFPKNLDPTRRSGTATLSGSAATVLSGARAELVDLARVILAAEAVGVARTCTEMAAEYAKVREQFGRPIAMFQGVKHHCSNMLVATELATAAVWDAARAAEAGGDQSRIATATAATLAGPAAYLCANLCMQVHGGIGFTWEHDTHLFFRRGTAIGAFISADDAAKDVVALTRAGVKRERTITLPPEAEQVREEVRAFADSIKGSDEKAKLAALIETGYVQPHWPKPWGREAGPVEQIVIEQEFGKAGISRPNYGITAWVILTLIQHATEEQVQRWVPPALRQDLIWCQLFSEPGAGSDAAGVRTKATRAEGGWIINGQKVWTSGAHLSAFGLATVRTDPDVPKHDGITTMVIDMKAPGVEVRPLRMAPGPSEFNEVFFNDVFVPDADVVGPINGGWTVARATLGNESVSIGGGTGAMTFPGEGLVGAFDQHPERLAGGEPQIGRYIASQQAMGQLNLRSASRAVAGAGPGPEGAVTKLVLSELGLDAAGILAELSGTDLLFMDEARQLAPYMVLMQRAMTIAGGTSEIKRNQIAERILGLPRDPLIK
ncbi:MAG TPA: acyl-CoA dehydrogenase [Mycobacteriales bacterium]|jgi:alkylation response protein AidB-like acyl-CoA dehydrogenase|nr:acyl-CoA dehydrogenase [Mycobacteriales bacterium]